MINRQQFKNKWKSWSFPEKCSVIGIPIAIFGILISQVSNGFSFSNDTPENLRVSTENVIHVIPGDFTFNLNNIRDNSYPNKYTVSLKVQARKTPVLLLRKALVNSFLLNEDYFVKEYIKDFKIVNVNTSSLSLENVSDTAEIELTLDTMFVFINPNDLVWNADSLSQEEMGKIEIKLYFQYHGNEISKIVNVPIRFI